MHSTPEVTKLETLIAQMAATIYAGHRASGDTLPNLDACVEKAVALYRITESRLMSFGISER